MSAPATAGVLPVYRWRLAPDGYATRRQLRAMSLRSGGQDVAAGHSAVETRMRAAWKRVTRAEGFA
ncbi:hypothetical protein [Streptomyces sp. NPDC005012]|uniref:hypothetical protein n=1 Tax=Streptomyces sp. NPDC005012 TaxID=3154558 RepID=UPI0033B5E5D9